jgi:hypothetical protein
MGRRKWHQTSSGVFDPDRALDGFGVKTLYAAGLGGYSADLFDRLTRIGSDPGETHMTTSTPDNPYALRNEAAGAGEMLSHLAAVLDVTSIDRLTRAGVGPGDTCLELGAGSGTIAAWMADQVGPTGRVIAVDIDPQHMQVPESVEVRTLNVIIDELPVARRIHARCLLAHLPTRLQVLAKIAAACEPGGTVTVEEWGQDCPGYVAFSPDQLLPSLYGRYQSALQAVFRRKGNDTSWARRAPGAMVDAGLLDVEFTVTARSWRGGEPGALLPHAVSVQLNDELTTTGLITELELERMRDGLLHPHTLLQSNGLHSVTGRKRWDSR